MRNTNKVKIIPLGGLHEIGKNLTVIEYRDDIIIVDCGMTFPEDEMLGIDVVIPDVTYLENNKDKIRGLVLTHGHEDHIGAIPYVLRKLDLDIYGTALTIGLLENKLKEHRLSRDKLHVVSAGNVVKLGKMEVEWINVNHSIPDACALAIKTPLGYVYHSGDFKVDFTPISGKPIDLTRIAEIGEKGVLAMIGESTNVLRPGYTMSESKVGETFNRLFQNLSENRIIIATFASNVHRVQQIINSAEKYGRKVVLSGRSMINVTETAKKLGQFRVKKDTFVDIKDMYKYDDSEIVLITTGSQGEPMSALTRIAYGEHRKIELTPNDAIILSATPIPGNENAVTKVINRLLERGAKVIYETLSEIHVSGHACQEELKLILSLIKPKYFIPAHGEVRHLMKHAKIAAQMGIPEDNIFIMENGNCLEISQKDAKLVGDVPSGNILVDGLGVGDVGNIVLRDRKHLSEDGLIIVVITITKEGKVVSGPDIISRGFVYVRESEDLIEDAKNVVRKILKEESNENLKDWNGLKSDIRDNLRSYILKNTKRNPMILPIIMEV
ncbi:MULTISPECIES: ribonuclease J [Peptoniphilus]|uniref:ribonuclease J n=1 Tax=Peptoniphilus TaxID=162289 RepID=UPI000288B1AE|nr:MULTISPECIES: ribonuclease J [Peptoniphilus]MBS6610928.1 ribonuclease J [Peptoniphilus harei]MDU1043936.1 ribonuclease J [Peptoniphilus rhinitidis]MDU1954790.1 ribonuclease J [Peptoniphilus lacydonensis]MDU2110371.1 ribonuclease J [Peptoniphilus lacydonensis]MDU2115718.1 ribonuclease J [Peptoniphilus lacydonensis]